MAGQLAKEYGEDPQKAEIAGLLHDYAKYIPDEQMLEYAKKFGIALCPAYEEKPNLMHGPVGAKLVEQGAWNLRSANSKGHCAAYDGRLGHEQTGGDSISGRSAGGKQGL